MAWYLRSKRFNSKENEKTLKVIVSDLSKRRNIGCGVSPRVVVIKHKIFITELAREQKTGGAF